jgi:hypothetical protein
LKFGFLIDKKEFICSDFSIVTADEIDEMMNSFYEYVQVSNGWIYGPEKELNKTSREKEKFKQLGPVVRDSFYRMSATHEIKTNITDEEHLRFLIIGYGFLQGLYLTPEGYSYLGRIPYEPGKLNGLLLMKDDYVNGMEIINDYYKSSSEEDRNQMFTCIHWFSIGQSFSFEWDRFEAQYKVLDGIYRLSRIACAFHSIRPVELANKYNIKLPKWAELDSTGKKSQLSIHRNELVHEAKYGGHPIGYSYPSENYSLEVTSFNTKLIAAALGIDTPYLQADPGNRCQWGWDINLNKAN